MSNRDINLFLKAGMTACVNPSLVIRFASFVGSGPSAIDKRLFAGGVDSVKVLTI